MSSKNVLKIFFCGVLAVGMWLSIPLANAAADQDGSIFSGKSCSNCSATRKSNKQVVIVDGTKKRTCANCPTPEFKTKNYAFAKPRYKSSKRSCCDLAPFALMHVDFKLDNQDSYNPYGGHVGNYRFRIFGCRRATKKAILNQGRVIQNDMDFLNVFKKAADKCYKIMDIPGDICLANQSVPLPEYVLTAEINNFFMNVCDEYDWEKAQTRDRRDGTAEMTVTWRLMNLGQTKVFWKGVTTGYAELDDGVYEGEVKLAEAAFADAAARLSSLAGFEAQLKVHPNPEQLVRDRAALAALDAQMNPWKCGGAPQPMRVAPQPTCPMAQPQCPCAMQQSCFCTQPVCSCPVMSCPCAQPVVAKPKVEEFVDVKTKKKIIEQKIITKTRVETPAPVCQQVCQPVCPQPTCQVQCTKTCQPSRCRRICTEVCDENGQCKTTCREDCGQPVQPKVEVIKYTPEVKAPVVEEKGGVVETHRVYENCVDEQGNVVYDEADCPNWIDWAKVDTSICIVDRPPYNELSPENMLKIRGSIVDITNAFGKKGTGLVISDSFILTSADLVNKLQNTYSVKMMNGELLQAKAVRINPGKNIALLHLDTPTTYTPLSLNTDLPNVDQEGFISLGQLGEGETTKSYMDDNGKIYGYRYSDRVGTEIIVDTLAHKVSPGSVLIDKLGTVNGISNKAEQTENGMDLFLPTDTALKSVGLSICEKVYEKKEPWVKPVTEQIKQETKAPEAMPAPKRK